MKKEINIYPLFFSILCWGGFYLLGFTSVPSVLPLKGHIIILWVAIFSLLMSVFGLGRINIWKSALSSLIPILLSGLLVVVELVLFVLSKILTLT